MTRISASAPRLLVTGFGPFPGASHNPTAELMDWLAGQPQGPAQPLAEIATAVFPTEWRALADTHGRLMAQHEPDIAIHFGLRASGEVFHIEQRAQNWKSGEPDATGERPSSLPVRTGKPRLLHTPYPVGHLVENLNRQGLPAQLSVDAGAYLCNMAYYLSLDSLGETGNPRSALFVHVPPIEASSDASTTAFSRSQLRNCALAVIDHALGELRAVETRETA